MTQIMFMFTYRVDFLDFTTGIPRLVRFQLVRFWREKAWIFSEDFEKKIVNFSGFIQILWKELSKLEKWDGYFKN